MNNQHKEWTPPKLWQDSTCYILGGGPSLSNVNFDLIKDSRIIAVNNAYGDPIEEIENKVCHYKPRNWVDICWFGDERWYWWHKSCLKAFTGFLVTCKESLRGTSGIYVIKRSRKQFGIDERPGFIRWNFNSGASAINLAYHLGVKKIVLLGFDMKNIEGKSNWHNDHQSTPRILPYTRFLKSFSVIKKDADRIGLEIINCTPESGMKEFPIMSLEEFLNGEECKAVRKAS